MEQKSQTSEAQSTTSNPPDNCKFVKTGTCGVCGEEYGLWVWQMDGSMDGFPTPKLCRCGKERVEEDRLRKLRQDEADREAKIGRLRSSYLATLPRGLHGCRVNNYRIPDAPEQDHAACRAAKDAVTAYILNLKTHRKSGEGMILIGNVGSGKSHLAAAIGSAACSAGYSVRFANADDLETDLRGVEYGNTCEILKPLKQCSFLILDDLGTEGMEERTQGWIHEIIKRRNADRNPTIFTTNLRMQDIANRYSARTRDCIMEYGLNQTVEILLSQSYRQGGRNA